MNMKLTRRQFSQLALASSAAIAVGTFATKTVAQTPPQVVLGIRPGSITGTDDSLTPEIDSTDQTDATATADQVASTVRTIVVESLAVASLEVKTQLTTPPILEFGDQLSGFAALSDGRMVAAVTSVDASRKADQPTRLIFLSASPTTQTVSGLKSNETLLSLQGLKDGSLIGIVGNKNSTPPFKLVSINPVIGQITDQRTLSENQRISNITECPNGNLYAIAVDQKGETNLVQIEPGQTTPLRYNNQPWNSGFSDLVCSPSNQLFALGAGRYEPSKYLHTIDQNTGVITRLKGFNVARITILAG